MPRPIIKIDPVLVHKITKYPDCVNHINESDLYKKVAAHYNAERNTMLFPDEIEWQTMGNRIKEWIKNGTIIIAYEIRKSTRGNPNLHKLSPQHSAPRIRKETKEGIENAVKEGLNLPANFQSPSSGMMNKWQNNMRENFAGKKILLNGLLKGNRKACVKAMCVMCMGGYIDRNPEDPAIADSIRDCRGVHCPLYIIRPFKEKTKPN